MNDVVCPGILVADVVARPVDAVPEAGTLGLVSSIVLRGRGCALNTSSALVRLGLRAAAIGKVGDDAVRRLRRLAPARLRRRRRPHPRPRGRGVTEDILVSVLSGVPRPHGPTEIGP